MRPLSLSYDPFTYLYTFKIKVKEKQGWVTYTFVDRLVDLIKSVMAYLVTEETYWVMPVLSDMYYICSDNTK